ncbi:unnamed protein product [Adineta ricciae]|nr:unnamed protein product [Adineta ricciae]
MPQLNLYFSDQVNENRNDTIGLRYNCLRLATNTEQSNIVREISSYCTSESSWKFSIKNDHTVQRFYFDDLAKQNISGEDLYLWSIPIDTIEHYQHYLETNDLSLAKQIVYNCTLPRFGPMCQYELHAFHEDYSTVSEIILNNYLSTGAEGHWTCETYLKCTRKHAPACLHWSEICDGRIDCLDGDFDEEHCWQLEINECKQNEYQCSNGLCIPAEFFNDDPDNTDCLDGSDEDRVLGSSRKSYGTFGWEDMKYSPLFITSYHHRYHQKLIVESMFSDKDPSVSNK